eukprot:g2882.t1
MADPFALDSIRAAIRSIHTDPSASSFLEQFQKSNEAWLLSVQLLEISVQNKPSSHEQLFAAQTLRSKLHCNLVKERSLPNNFLQELHGRLLAIAIRLSHIGDSMKLVSTQILLCIACLVVRLADTWKAERVCDEVCTHFYKHDVPLAALRFLQLLPEEVTCKRLEVAKQRRMDICHGLRSNITCQAVLQQLEKSHKACIDSNNFQMLCECFMALESWVNFHCLPSKVLFSFPLVNTAFSVLAVTETQLDGRTLAMKVRCCASSLLCSIFETHSSSDDRWKKRIEAKMRLLHSKTENFSPERNHETSEKKSEIVTAVNSVLNLGSAMASAVSSKDVEWCNNILSVVIAAVERLYPDLIGRNTPVIENSTNNLEFFSHLESNDLYVQYALQLFSLLVEATKLPFFQLTERLFAFWASVADRFANEEKNEERRRKKMSKKKRNNLPENKLISKNNIRELCVIPKIISQVIQIFADRSVYPMSIDLYTADMMEDFKDARMRSRQCISDMFRAILRVGRTDLIQLILLTRIPSNEKLQTLQKLDNFGLFSIEKKRNIIVQFDNQTHHQHQYNWCLSEIALWLLRCACDGSCIQRDDANIVEPIVEACCSNVNGNTVNPFLRSTIVDVARCCDTWLNDHPHFLPPFLDIILHETAAGHKDDLQILEKMNRNFFVDAHCVLMNEPSVLKASLASITFSKICGTSAKTIAQKSPNLLDQLIGVYCKISNHLSAHICRALLSGLSKVSCQLAPNDAQRTLHLLVSDAFQCLENYVQQNNVDKETVPYSILLASMYISSVVGKWWKNQPQLIFNVVMRYWPIYSLLLDRAAMGWSRPDFDTMIRYICFPIVQVLKLAPRDTINAEMIGIFVNKLCLLYSKLPYHTILFIIGDCAEIIVNNRINIFSHAISSIVNSTSMHLNRLGGPNALPELVCDFFHLFTKLIQLSPESFLENNCVDTFINASILCLSSQERQAAHSVLQFIESYSDVVSNGKKLKLIESNLFSFIGESQSQSIGIATNPIPEKNGKQKSSLHLCSLIEESCVKKGNGTEIFKSLLYAAAGGMPSWMLSNVVVALHKFCIAFGINQSKLWLEQVLCDDCFKRVGKKCKLEFANQLMNGRNFKDKTKFKRLVKHFCGGKRKGEVR